MLDSKVTWLIVANTAAAKVFEIKHKEYSLVETLEHPESRLKSKDLTSDRPGRYKTDHSTHGAFAPSVDAHKEVHHQFAREIAQLLETGLQNKEYQNIILCAEPHFHGLLNHVMPVSVRDSIIRTIEKDYIPFPKPKMNSMIESIIQETRISHL